MEYRKLGTSDLNVSVITFGSFAAGGWLWGKTDHNAAVEAIRASYELGVTSIDTAPIYGMGESEDIVGEAIKGLPRDKVQLFTKYGMRWDLAKGTFRVKSKDNNGKEVDIYKYAGKESIIYECEQSLKRLGTDYIDLYQIHWDDVTTPIAESMEAVAQLIQQGKVRFAGVCNYTAAQMAEAEKIVPLVSNQIPFSMVNRGVEEETVPYCMDHNKAVLAYSPLERGLLTGKIKPGHQFPEGDQRSQIKFYSEENVKKTNRFLERIKPLAQSKQATLSQLVIRWTVEQPGITIALVGARNAQQAIQNAQAIQVKLTRDEIDFITMELSTI